MSSGLEVRNLCCVRQQQPLFANLGFEIKSGEILLIEGPNGSGKSSLLRLLSGLASPEQGTILWRGGDIHQLREAYWKELHYIGHANGIKLGLSVSENLRLAGSLALEPVSTPLHEVLRAWNLQSCENFPATSLSAGQKRRLALARLTMLSKPLWLLDEPLTALDTGTQSLFLSHLENHQRQGGIAVISSHHSLPRRGGITRVLRLSSC